MNASFVTEAAVQPLKKNGAKCRRPLLQKLPYPFNFACLARVQLWDRLGAQVRARTETCVRARIHSRTTQSATLFESGL